MNRSEIDKKIARLDALSGIIPLSAADQSERDLLVAERDDMRFEAQKAMVRLSYLSKERRFH